MQGPGQGSGLTVRVVHVVCDLSPGGAERVVLSLCQRASPGVEARVCAVQGLGPLEAAFAASGIPVVAAGRVPGTLGLGSLRRISRELADADVVHTHLFAGDTWGRLAAILAHKKAVVTTEHNVDRDERWRRGVRRALAPLTRVVVAVSEAAARATFGRDVRVVPNGVDLSPYARPHLGGAGLLAVGRRVPQKGFDVLCAALPPGVPLRIAGDGPFRRNLPGVEWLGLREDVPELMRAADVVAIPSRWEGFGLVAVEAMAAGVAVVASAVGGLPEVLGDAALFVPPEDPGALRAAIQRLLGDADLRRELGARGRARARRFAVERMVRAYESIYAEVVA
jgi:glycosyltransferase involved in cell wall biosynthesis